MNRIKKIILIVIYFSAFQFQLIGQVIENYDSKLEYVVQSGWFQSSEIVQASLDIRTFPNSEFLVKIPSGATLFVGQVLWFNTSNDTIFRISRDALEAKFKLKEVSEIDFSVLKKGIRTSDVSIKKGYFDKPTPQELAREELAQNFEERRVDNFNDFYFLSLIAILFLIAIYKMFYPLVLNYIVNPQGIFNAEDFSESNSLQKFFSLDIIFYIIIVNMLLALIAMVGVREVGFEYFSRFVEGSINELFLYWLFATLILFGLTMIKFLFIKFMSIIYELGKNEFSHFFYLLRVVSVLALLFSLVISYFVLNSPEDLAIVVKISSLLVFWIYLICIGLLMFIMMNRVAFNNYHLFAYICTAELVPFLIISKLIMG
ncbi:DUF4271 domain-containing protein [Belliella sp. R4-6]|uniref:DUF4271 domain-containing protein n=1 Tax=Belliella alkalica TaxID=1730871 RepID=A0ABS9VC30_9BACT|nr:DUF4271 domain-containing protein [Belliella alkalica]MCH7413999.1 DUF4271 domain-containing protein [Belliella alkalica]